MKGMDVAVTGGLGFIGSHLTDELLRMGNRVTVIDDLSSGKRENLMYPKHENLEIIEGSINEVDLDSVFRDKDYVFHQAALASVPESVRDPLRCHRVNATGTLRVLLAACRAGVRKVVNASTSAVYGNNPEMPLSEDARPMPLSPYAVSKVTGEYYCSVFEDHGLETVSLRYFNVYGPRQRPDSQYAAVIPRFIDALLQGRQPEIYGDGEQSRDFIYVGDVVRANIFLAESPETGIFNVAGGSAVTVNRLFEIISRILGSDSEPVFLDERPGDVRHSLADTSRLEAAGFRPDVKLEEGLIRTVEWFKG
ncbi:SDR family oxidoreductase [Methanothermobacter sp. THM-2]|uniref:SDR family oxidoreductase n=1 Tax=Methanothermobacter sp. THM-2 TaxID=2606912 RepID=UPI0013658379|nr:SDR family oxidoreductase [Methanothermobacter sp. THM-2]QHN08784.1 SDR family oxidoreductase [Methanothermobacter sp. THM-2]